jgi:Holliday junction DNA helicase RuvA
MFNSLSGEVTLREDERLCVATGGVEWELAVSRKASARFPAPGQPVRVYTYLLHREDAMKLYGFLDPAERSLFLDLQKVDGVGPRGAMRILSGIERKDFVEALDRDDVDALSLVPGIGKKTAQKIIGRGGGKGVRGRHRHGTRRHGLRPQDRKGGRGRGAEIRRCRPRTG